MIEEGFVYLLRPPQLKMRLRWSVSGHAESDRGLRSLPAAEDVAQAPEEGCENSGDTTAGRRSQLSFGRRERGLIGAHPLTTAMRQEAMPEMMAEIPRPIPAKAFAIYFDKIQRGQLHSPEKEYRDRDSRLNRLIPLYCSRL